MFNVDKRTDCWYFCCMIHWQIADQGTWIVELKSLNVLDNRCTNFVSALLAVEMTVTVVCLWLADPEEVVYFADLSRDRSWVTFTACILAQLTDCYVLLMSCCVTDFQSNSIVFPCTRLQGCIRLRNDLYCVEWGVKLYSLTHSLCVQCNTVSCLLLHFVCVCVLSAPSRWKMCIWVAAFSWVAFAVALWFICGSILVFFAYNGNTSGCKNPCVTQVNSCLLSWQIYTRGNRKSIFFGETPWDSLSEMNSVWIWVVKNTVM